MHGQPAIAAALGQQVRASIRRGVDARTSSGVPEGLRPAVEAAVRAVDAEGEVEIANLEVTLESDLPIAVGLGSSAALAVALVRGFADAKGQVLSDDETARAANEVEKVFHGTPSGIDATTATRRGLLCFEIGPPTRCEPIRADLPPIVVVLSGTRHHTGQTVGGLRMRAEAAPDVYRPVFRAVGDLVRAARVAIVDSAWPKLGELMSMNHELLRACGVSTDELDRVVADARACGALGAKLTGAGGGGAAIALANGETRSLIARLRERGWEAFAAFGDHFAESSPS